MVRKTALVVDDISINRMILSDLLEDEFDILEASNGTEALSIIKSRAADLSVVLLDLVMPEVSGFDVLDEINRLGLINLFPVLIITGEDSAEIEERCLSSGAFDFITKPFVQSIVKTRIDNAVSLFQLKNNLEEKVTEQTIVLKEQNEKLSRINSNIVELLGDIVEARNMESGLHVKRVKGFTNILAEDIKNMYPEYGLDEHAVFMITVSSSMHDVGKIMVPDGILLKPGRLTPEEFDSIKKHSAYGAEILDNAAHLLDEEHHRYSREIALSHHERYDGSGYPNGLKGDEIPISAQIVSVADTYDALVTERCYKKPFSKEDAFNMIISGECGAFNPKLMDSFTRHRRDMEALVV